MPDRCVIHSFRDRLRAVWCPSDMIDQIGGWSAAGVGQSYGGSYDPKRLSEWIKQIMLAEL